jgi:hypothetical protein
MKSTEKPPWGGFSMRFSGQTKMITMARIQGIHARSRNMDSGMMLGGFYY